MKLINPRYVETASVRYEIVHIVIFALHLRPFSSNGQSISQTIRRSQVRFSLGTQKSSFCMILALMRTRIQNYNMYIYIYIFTLLIIAYTKSLARFINIFYLFYHFYVETLTNIVTCLPSYKHPLDIYLRNRTLPPCIQTRERALL